MMNFLQSLLAFLAALGVLIAFHEFGHFWVARRCDVKILRFSLGFGQPLWTRHFGPDRSEFVVATLPLGGYVKMLDEREGPVAAEESARAFNNKPLLQRAAIVVAGPVANFIFAITVYWVVYMAGITGLKPIVGDVIDATPAARAGVVTGDRIVRVDGTPTPTWSSVLDVVVGKVVAGGEVKVVLAGAEGRERTVRVNLSGISVDDLAGGSLLRRLGVEVRRPTISATVGELVAGGAAERDGLHPGDRVQAVNGIPVRDWGQWVEVVRAHPDTELQVEVLRGKETLTLHIRPQAVTAADGKTIGRIGAAVDAGSVVDPDLVGREAYGPLDALLKSVSKTSEISMLTLRVLGKMITGQASVRNLSGPISIAQYAGESAGSGLLAFSSFLAIVSISLGVLNLLPIPLLDGGHLMYYLIELASGKPLSESAQAFGQQVGLVLLLGLMGLAIYNDLLRILG